MLRSFLIAFYRTTARHPLYALLNVLGLAFGIVVFIIISLYVHFEATYDGWLRNAPRIYEVSTTYLGRTGRDSPSYSSAGLAKDVIQTAVPQVRATRLVRTFSVFKIDEDPIEEEEYLADANLFDVLDLPLVAGKKAGALRPDSIVLSESMARKYFGHTDIIGRHLALRDLIAGIRDVPEGASQPKVYTVTAVVRDPPPNSSLHFNFVRLLTPERIAMYRTWNSWEGSMHRTFLLLDGAGQAAQLNQQLDHLVDSHGQSPAFDAELAGRPRHEILRIRVVPLGGEHLTDNAVMRSVVALGVLGSLAFGIALVNYVNLATARSAVRAREVALRRCMGATVSELRLQFLGEAVLVSLVALILGFSFVELSLPLINHLGQTQLRLHYLQGWPLLGGLTLAVLLCGAAAGLYPAFVMAGYQPAQVFASTRSPSGGRLALTLRELLVFVQFTLVSAFLIVVFGFTTQLRHLQTSDLGFDRQGLLMTNALINNTLGPGKSGDIMAQWRALPNVTSITSGMAPGRYFSKAVYTVTPAGRGQPMVDSSLLLSGDHYFTVFGTPVLAGRSLEGRDQVSLSLLPFGRAPALVNVVINERAVQSFGFAAPQAAVGQDLSLTNTTLHIVGVVGNQRLDTPANQVMPTIYVSVEQMAAMQTTILKYQDVSEDVMKARMTSVWRRVAPDMPIDLTSVRGGLDYYYNADRRMTRLFAMGAVLVGLIGVIGLFGMAAFSTSARANEIGLRKAMGGSQANIAVLLVTQFLRPVLLANLVAWPLAWIVLDRWLRAFDDRTALSVWFFLAGSAISLLVAVMTVAGLAFAAAGTSPGQALRRE